MITITKKDNQEISENQEVKKLSKVGVRLRSGQSFGIIVDMRAVLR